MYLIKPCARPLNRPKLQQFTGLARQWWSKKEMVRRIACSVKEVVRRLLQFLNLSFHFTGKAGFTNLIIFFINIKKLKSMAYDLDVKASQVA